MPQYFVVVYSVWNCTRHKDCLWFFLQEYKIVDLHGVLRRRIPSRYLSWYKLNSGFSITFPKDKRTSYKNYFFFLLLLFEYQGGLCLEEQSLICRPIWILLIRLLVSVTLACNNTFSYLLFDNKGNKESSFRYCNCGLHLWINRHL